jgi:pimeloyl-ACP methyl ester carboxylesterase
VRKLLGWLALLAGVLAAVFLAVRTPDIPGEELKRRYATAASRFVELSPGFRVHLRDEGPRDAPVLLLVHGSNASLHTWEPWVAALSGRFRVVTLDMQGHGLTGPHPDGCYSGECMAATVEAARAHLGIERMAVGGNSMGGAVSIRYALAHPDRVSALILVDSAGAQIDPDRPPPVGFRIAGMPVVRDLATVVTPRSMIERSLDQSTSVKAAAAPEKVDRYWELLRYPGNRAATIARFGTPRQPITAEMLAPLAGIPTLILWGREDRLFPPAAADWFKAAIPTAEMIVYDGVGHIPQEEAPERSAADVGRFLDRVSPPRDRLELLQTAA